MFVTALPPPASTLFPYTTLFRSPRRRDKRGTGLLPARTGRPGRGKLAGSDRLPESSGAPRSGTLARALRPASSGPGARSEEHTSELQSRGHLVCRLLLEKKKTNT